MNLSLMAGQRIERRVSGNKKTTKTRETKLNSPHRFFVSYSRCGLVSTRHGSSNPPLRCWTNSKRQRTNWILPLAEFSNVQLAGFVSKYARTIHCRVLKLESSKIISCKCPQHTLGMLRRLVTKDCCLNCWAPTVSTPQRRDKVSERATSWVARVPSVPAKALVAATCTLATW